MIADDEAGFVDLACDPERLRASRAKHPEALYNDLRSVRRLEQHILDTLN